MKKRIFTSTMIFLLLLGSACSRAVKTTGPSSADIYTAVAITLTSQASGITPTATTRAIPSPTMAMLLPSPLPHASQTEGASLPTQNVANTLPPVNHAVCPGSTYLSDVTIPDGTVLAPGQAFVKTWKFQNSGTCSWSSADQIAFASGNKLGGSSTVINQAVSAGSNANISVSLTAPTAEGTYTGYWRMADENGNFFGGLVYVNIKVSKNAKTVTPTPAITATGDTRTPTDTAEVSETTAVPTRTRTPSRTSRPTNTLTPIPGDLPTETLTPKP